MIKTQSHKMEILKQADNITAQICAKHLRLKSRITEKVYKNKTKIYTFAAMLYTVKVQVKILGIWVTVWAETCDYSDGDTRPYIKNCAEEIKQVLTTSV